MHQEDSTTAIWNHCQPSCAWKFPKSYAETHDTESQAGTLETIWSSPLPKSGPEISLNNLDWISDSKEGKGFASCLAVNHTFLIKFLLAVLCDFGM